MRVKLTALSPLHIGSGETFEPLDFFQLRSPPAICYVTFEQLYPHFTPRHWTQFAAWMDRQRGRGANWYRFFQEELGDRREYDRIAKQLKRRVENRSNQMITQPIFAFIRSGGMPYLPGSSVKGALRNALAFDALAEEGSPRYAQLQGQLQKAQAGKIEPKRAVKSGGERLDTSLFRVAGKDDAKYDLLKFLQVGDSSAWEESRLFVSYIQVKGLSRTVTLYHELCPAGQVFELPVTFSPAYLAELGFDETQRRMATIEHLFTACYRFAESLLEEETASCLQQGLRQEAAHLQSIRAQNTQETPLLRLGKHTGFFSSTVSLAVKQRHFELFDQVIRPATRGRNYPRNFPKTRRLVFNGQSMESPGWVKLERT